jgi:hypothetical protein
MSVVGISVGPRAVVDRINRDLAAMGERLAAQPGQPTGRARSLPTALHLYAATLPTATLIAAANSGLLSADLRSRAEQDSTTEFTQAQVLRDAANVVRNCAPALKSIRDRPGFLPSLRPKLTIRKQQDLANHLDDQLAVVLDDLAPDAAMEIRRFGLHADLSSDTAIEALAEAFDRAADASNSRSTLASRALAALNAGESVGPQGAEEALWLRLSASKFAGGPLQRSVMRSDSQKQQLMNIEAAAGIVPANELLVSPKVVAPVHPSAQNDELVAIDVSAHIVRKAASEGDLSPVDRWLATLPLNDLERLIRRPKRNLHFRLLKLAEADQVRYEARLKAYGHSEAVSRQTLDQASISTDASALYGRIKSFQWQRRENLSSGLNAAADRAQEQALSEARTRISLQVDGRSLELHADGLKKAANDLLRARTSAAMGMTLAGQAIRSLKADPTRREALANKVRQAVQRRIELSGRPSYSPEVQSPLAGVNKNDLARQLANVDKNLPAGFHGSPQIPVGPYL